MNERSQTLPAEVLAAFGRDAVADGFSPLLERRWDAHEVVALHTHPFDARCIVSAGELWLTVGGESRHFQRGDVFEVARGVLHEERYGPEGATFWTARRV
jgi:hypothetical protein